MGQPSAGAARRASPPTRPQPWPFYVQDPLAEIDNGVPRRQEIEFADGARIWLLRVDANGVGDLFLRELGAPAAGVLVDLRHLAPDLTSALPAAPARDVPGLVHIALRAAFQRRGEFLIAAIAVRRPG